MSLARGFFAAALTGESGNPAGRPKGSRNRLSETFLSALAVDFDQHGIWVIERVRMERPHDYLRIVVGALPKDMNMSLSTRQRPLEFMTDAELTAILRDSEQFLAASQDNNQSHPLLRAQRCRQVLVCYGRPRRRREIDR
jgi:hypothetical protein